LPALSVPCGTVTAEGATSALPMGLQLCAPLFEERRLLSAAHAYEQATRHADSHALDARLNSLAATIEREQSS